MRAVRSLAVIAAVAAPAAGCGSPPAVSDAKRARLALIRDTAAGSGVTNAALLAGIAESETNVAHCWSDATFACMGPASPSCGGEPIIAGAADGPCEDMRGGLGMFQFDAGSHDDTRARYGDAILTIEGNTAQAVAFVIDIVIREVAGAGDPAAAVAWINGVPLVAGDPVTEQWARLVACRYNGCCSDSATCTARAAGYRDNAIELYHALGDGFWRVER